MIAVFDGTKKHKWARNKEVKIFNTRYL